MGRTGAGAFWTFDISLSLGVLLLALGSRSWDSWLDIIVYCINFSDNLSFVC
jgi:hypothetical protein